ncbi:MAG: penicillin-binding protein activator [Anaerolineales bacterium]|nr:penicillin-binding protein activator [Anaerolineales bacterium]
MKRKLWFSIGLVLIVLGAGAYQAEPMPAVEQTQAAALQTTPEAAGDVEEVTLGVVLPFTGSLGEYGVAFGEGVELAVEQMNAQLEAAGRPIRFVIASADTEGTPDGAAKAIQTVVQTSGAQVVVGPLATTEVLGAKQFADSNKITIIAPASSGLAGAIPNDYIFRVMQPPDTFQSQAFEGVAIARGYENVVILHMDDPFGNGMAESFTQRFQEAGGSEVVAVKYAPEPTDLSSEVTRVSSEIATLSGAGNTAFLCICFLGDAQKVLQQAVVDPILGTVDWLGAENLRSPEILADPAQAEFLASVNFTSVSASSLSNPNTQPFIDAYSAKFGKEPGPFTNYAYDAANIAMLSIAFAGNNGEAVQKIVPFIASHYIGTQVQTYLDENGDQAIAVLTVYQVNEDGSDFMEVGTYDGSTGETTLNDQASIQ